MSSQQGASTLGNLKRGTGWWRQFAGAAALALLVAAAIGIWQSTSDAEKGPAAVVQQEADPVSVAPRLAAERPMIYLASSQAQADVIQATLDDAAALVEEVNMLPATRSAVTVIETGDYHMRLLQLVGSTDVVNAALGLPIMQVIDLRWTGDAAASADAGQAASRCDLAVQPAAC
jgi:hypothetical protein